MVLVGLLLAIALKANEVRLEIHDGRFSSTRVHIASGAVLRLVNGDDLTYTIESPGAFTGDIQLDPHKEAVVGVRRGGSFVALIEEKPDSQVELEVDENLERPTSTQPPFEIAKSEGLQPLDYNGKEPAYGAISTFDIAVTGQQGRQKILTDLYKLQEELASDDPSGEFRPYFSHAEWLELRSTAAMLIGLGPTAYDSARFGSQVAESKPTTLHPISNFSQLSKLGLPKTNLGQRDILIRVTSDSAWFNLRVCRLIWKTLGTRISNPELEWGYAGPAGRSPILGGFYDGTGNPSGEARRRALFGPDSTSMLALYRIKFDEDSFARKSLGDQEAVVGRVKDSGKQTDSPMKTSHKVRASVEKQSIVRMPLIYDEGVRGTGLLFVAAGNSFVPLESILTSMSATPRDGLLKYIRFESAGYYAIPPSPQGGYPGSLRKSAFTFGS